MNRNHHIIAILILLGAVAVAAYLIATKATHHRLTEAQSHAPASALQLTSKQISVFVPPQTERKSTSEITVPARFRLDNKAHSLRPANDTINLLSRYSGRDHEEIKAFYDAVGDGVFAFRSEEQLSWLLQNGYPTPDEILLSKDLTDLQLQQLAKNGNFKGQAFYLDRILRGASKRDTDSVATIIETTRILDNMLSTGSPFAGWVLARYKTIKSDPAGALAAYTWSYMAGDSRTSSLLNDEALNLDVIAGEALSNYAALQRQTIAQSEAIMSQRRIPNPESH